jgi:hypothetical protein
MPQPGDFGLVKMPGNVGRLISVGEFLNGDGFGWYDHAFVLLDDATIMEAEPGGARIRPADEYADVTWSSWTLSGAARYSIVMHARELEHTPYSAADYFALAAHRLRIPVPGLESFVKSTGHMICSQLVDEAYARAGLHMFADDRWPGYVTPASLSRALTGTVV